MQSNRYRRVLIPLIALSLTSCSAGRNLTASTRSREEAKSLAAELGRMEESVLSMRKEISRICLESLRRTSLSEDEDVERITETFDTDKPADPVTGVHPLLSRETERRTNRRERASDETARIISSAVTDNRDTALTTIGIERLEVSESENGSAVEIQETAPGKGLPRWLRTLTGIGVIAIILTAGWLFLKFR